MEEQRIILKCVIGEADRYCFLADKVVAKQHLVDCRNRRSLVYVVDVLWLAQRYFWSNSATPLFLRLWANSHPLALVIQQLD